jgi:hypothetical protein
MWVAADRIFGEDMAAHLGHILENLFQLFTVGDTTGEEAERDATRWGLISGYEGLSTDTRSHRKVKVYTRLNVSGTGRLLAKIYKEKKEERERKEAGLFLRSHHHTSVPCLHAHLLFLVRPHDPVAVIIQPHVLRKTICNLNGNPALIS